MGGFGTGQGLEAIPVHLVGERIDHEQLVGGDTGLAQGGLDADADLLQSVSTGRVV
jgi:hypothetical protein